MRNVCSSFFFAFVTALVVLSAPFRVLAEDEKKVFDDGCKAMTEVGKKLEVDSAGEFHAPPFVLFSTSTIVSIGLSAGLKNYADLLQRKAEIRSMIKYATQAAADVAEEAAQDVSKDLLKHIDVMVQEAMADPRTVAHGFESVMLERIRASSSELAKAAVENLKAQNIAGLDLKVVERDIERALREKLSIRELRSAISSVEEEGAVRSAKIAERVAESVARNGVLRVKSLKRPIYQAARTALAAGATSKAGKFFRVLGKGAKVGGVILGLVLEVKYGSKAEAATLSGAIQKNPLMIYSVAAPEWRCKTIKDYGLTDVAMTFIVANEVLDDVLREAALRKAAQEVCRLPDEPSPATEENVSRMEDEPVTCTGDER